jgi:hypothetical protein
MAMPPALLLPAKIRNPATDTSAAAILIIDFIAMHSFWMGFR